MRLRIESDRFHDFFDVLFGAVLDLLKFLFFAEFSKVSFNHVEEFVDVLQKSCELCTDLTCIQFQSGFRIGSHLIRLFTSCTGKLVLKSQAPVNMHVLRLRLVFMTRVR